MSETGDYGSVRAIEMRLIEEVGSQLKGVVQALQALTLETRDMRDRLIKIEAQNQPEALKSMQGQIVDLYERLNQADRDRAEEAKADIGAASEYKLAVERRMTKVEMIVIPVTLAGAAVISGMVAAIMSHFVH